MAAEPAARWPDPPERSTDPTARRAAWRQATGRIQAARARARGRLWRPALTLLAVLVVLGGLVAIVLVAASRQTIDGTADGTQAPGSAAVASPSPSPSVTATAVPTPAAVPAASPTAAPMLTATTTPTRVTASPTPPTVTPGTATPSRPGSPVIVPTVPGLVAPAVPILIGPPSFQFSTSTPARIGTPTRTPPPVPTIRPANPNTPLRADRPSYKVGDDATICAQASYGVSAQIDVLGPEGTTRTLGEFQPPADRVCQTMRLDNPGIYVVTLTVKDSGGRELERHALVVMAAR